MAGEQLKKIITERGIKYIGFLVKTLNSTKSYSFANKEETHFFFISRFPVLYLEKLEKENKLDGLTLVILKSSILYEEDNFRTYYPMYHKNPKATGYKTRLNENSFEKLFLSRLAYKTKSGEIRYYSRNKELLSCYTTLSNASVEWEGNIDSKYVLYTLSAYELLETNDFDEMIRYQEEAEEESALMKEEEKRLEEMYDEAVRRDSLYGTNEAEQYSKALIKLNRPFSDGDEFDEDTQDESYASASCWSFDQEEDYWEIDMGYKEPDDYGDY